MPQLIDRRQWGSKRSTVNRQRFIRRYKEQIKRALVQQIGGRAVTDLHSGETVTIPARDLTEPIFSHGAGGRREHVFPGNHQYVQGDRIASPDGGAGGQGSGSDGAAGQNGDGADEFRFEVTRDEYLELMFEDLELPRLDIRQNKRVERFRNVRAGFRADGVPANLSVVRSLERAFARRIALSGSARSELKSLEKQLEEELDASADGDPDARRAMIERVEELRARIARVPYLDTFDLRFRAFARQPLPTTQAVMFCLMDVSGSMDQQRKDIAKRFFLLLHLFLHRNYRNVQVIFIRHHAQAKEVDEHEFFYAQETGGTVVSSALNLLDELIHDRFPPDQWNVYVAQASDGDNWYDDSPKCNELLATRILPLVRYFAYIEIAERPQGLWEHYAALLDTRANLAVRRILKAEDIFPIFRELFQKHA
jgi:uncharacterized sporulation protein YeaH/YhbH (DUF444 family)